MLILAGLGLGVRLMFFQQYTFLGTDCDGAGYLEVARHILSGQGWSSHYQRILFLPLRPMPQPDAYWSPLYPLLLSIAFALGGQGFGVAKLVGLSLGVLIPPATFLLTLGLSGRRAAGFLAGLVAVFHPTLVVWSLRILSENGTILLVTAALCCLLLRPRRGWLLGALMGLAYLMKYQSILLWPPLVLGMFLVLPWKRALRSLLFAGLAFVLVCSPWLVRNMRDFGDPLYFHLKYHSLANYPEFGLGHRFEASPRVPPSLPSYAVRHPGVVARQAVGGVHTLVTGMLRHHRGSIFLLPLGLMGMWVLRARWRLWLPILFYAALLLCVMGLTMPQERYMFSLIPFWLALGGVGLESLFTRMPAFGHARRRFAWAAFALLVTGAVVVDEASRSARSATVRIGDWCPAANYCVLETLACRPYLWHHCGAGTPVFVCEVYHAALLLDRSAITCPFSAAQLRQLSRQVHGGFLAISVRDLRLRLPAWLERTPDWVRMVARVPADSIRKSNPGTAGMGLSEMRIFALNP